MEDELTSEWTPPPPGNLPELAPEALAAVRALQGGEVEESTRLLFETFQPQLVAYFRRHRCDDLEADDLAQTVFLRMLDQIGTLKEATSFHFWLFKIARHSLYNFVRDKGRSSESFEDLAGKARKDSESSAFWVRGTFEPSPEAKLAVSETVDRRRRLLRKLLGVTKLAPRTLQSLVRRLHGESYEEIGRALEIPAGTARSHVSRASAALIRNLDGIDPDDVALEDGVNDDANDVVADLSSELLTFKREALEADPAYFRAGMLEAGSADYDKAEESDEADGDEEDYEDEEEEVELESGFDSSAEIDAVVREDRARGRSRRRVTRTIEPAGRRAQELALGPVEKEDLGYPRILLEEAAVYAAELGRDGAELALRAKLTCADSLLGRGRRFKTAREVQEIVRQASVLIGNGRCDGNGDEIRHKVLEGCTLLRSFLGG